MNLSDNHSAYSEQVFENLTVADEEIAFKEFESCTFLQCAFLETSFRGCRFLNCTFQECQLNLVHVKDCSFFNTTFERAKVIGVNWTEAVWGKKTGLHTPVNFFDCVINHSTFTGLNLKKMTLTRCLARDVDFADADLTHADCTQTDFAQSRFLHTNLTHTDFRGATNYTIAANLNTLKKTRFSLPEVMSLLYSLDIVLDD